METNRLPVLLVGLLHLSLAFPHGADHLKNCTIHERVSFIIKGGTGEGDFIPEVIPLNNTRLEVVGEPRGNVVEEVRNGVKYSIIKTLVRVVIAPPPTTSSPATSPPITFTPTVTTTEGTTTSSSVSEDPGEFITLSGFGSYKYHKSEPIENMMEICAKEDAVVAYPIYLEEVDAIVEEFNTSTTCLAVGVKWNGTGMYNFEHDTPYFNENLWDSGEPSNITGNCSALDMVSKRMKSVSCSEELPFLCKKDDGFERGYGFYTYHGPADISKMEFECEKNNRTVAVPHSLEEAELMVTHALDNDLYLSVGIMKVVNDTREQYMRVGVVEEVDENVCHQVYVNISTDLWEGGKPSGSGNCIVLRVSSKRLIGNRCGNVTYPFICKKDLTPPRSVYISDKKITYQYQPWYKNTSEATASCIAQGFTSVAFPQEENYDKEAVEIADLIPDDELYIATGIERRNTSEGTYKILGLNRNFEYNSSGFWEGGEPKYAGDCIKFSKKSRKFLDFDCGTRLPYICVKHGN